METSFYTSIHSVVYLFKRSTSGSRYNIILNWLVYLFDIYITDVQFVFINNYVCLNWVDIRRTHLFFNLKDILFCCRYSPGLKIILIFECHSAIFTGR